MDLYSAVLLLLMIFLPIGWLCIAKEYALKKALIELLPKSKGISEEVLGGLALFCILVLSFLIVSLLLTALGLNDLEKVSEVIAQEKNNMLEFSLFMVFAVFAEEYFFRSFLIKRFALFFSKFFSKIKKIEKDFVKKASSVSAIIFSTLIFAFAHFGYESVAQIIGAFLLGLILAYWFFKNNSLLQNYLGHLFYNLLVIVIYIVFT